MTGAPEQHEPGRKRTWRDQPRGLACAIIAAFVTLTAFAFGIVILGLVLAIR